ncbi:HAD family hydrolase [Aquibacillus kalidii]|uniref:HAD family hydrolase n=1 Tax=Aquibacillus kalidii TaxID=2762597 RepID=UPI00164881D0|nr:HAD family hydrolase [Aquibacillus kalidii]
MLKLFATDLDGTLLGKGNHIIDEDKHAIHRLISQGIEFAVATGRMDRDIVKILTDIEAKGHRISQNGAFVFDKENRRLYKQTFNKEVSTLVHKAVAEHHDVFCITTADEIYISKKTAQIREFEPLLLFPLLEGVDFIHEYGQRIHPSKYMLIGETDEIIAAQDKLNASFSDVTESYLSDNHCVDIVPKGTSKAVGLEQLVKNMSIKPEEIAVIGDSFNDIPMFEMTPYSYAMESAHPDVKKKASKVVKHVHEAIDDILIHTRGEVGSF